MAEPALPLVKPMNGGGGGVPAPPSIKPRPVYRPQPPSKAPRRRGRLCTCCLWITFVVSALILLAAIAGGIFYLLYRPHRPTFTVSTFRLSALNVTASNQLASRLDLSITARNPNRKLVFSYDPISISASSNGVAIGNVSVLGFVQGTKNNTVLKTTVTTSGQRLDSPTASDLKKSNVPIEIDMETKVIIKIGALKTKKIPIGVSCSAINAAVPKTKGKKAVPAPEFSPDASCDVKMKIKIWKWTV
ncbi:hypothetical protein J5N97_012952 [Dioscorea zingiberensis]|uniref:Late embryogenesis abundant protein LEA-2 subgroup domain-containing protein n=1 Tax=Dioscorea zingiberensis TaxID=325984 RepID=A0A9D5HIB8_9LILI|nr:hypothetical protein J5N97_012952 [Dioscorea zingiberensis]